MLCPRCHKVIAKGDDIYFEEVINHCVRGNKEEGFCIRDSKGEMMATAYKTTCCDVEVSLDEVTAEFGEIEFTS